MYMHILATSDTTRILEAAGYLPIDHDTYEKITSRFIPPGFVVAASINIETKLYWYVHTSRYSPLHTDQHLREIIVIRESSSDAAQAYLKNTQGECIDGCLHVSTPTP